MGNCQSHDFHVGVNLPMALILLCQLYLFVQYPDEEEIYEFSKKTNKR